MEMNIVLGSSSNYLPYTAVTVASVCHHMEACDKAVFHIMHAGDVTDRESDRFRAELGRFADRAAVEFVEVPDSLSLAERIRTSPYIKGSATYLRLYLPRIFHDNLSRVVYLDSDLAVCVNLRELFELDMRGACLAGVEDKLSLSHLRSLGLPEDGRYVNAGVLAYDLAKVDVHKMETRLDSVLNSRRRYGIITGDQDLLALLFHDATHYLHPSWNVMPRNSFLGRSYIGKRCGRQTRITREETLDSFANPRIIHYIGDRKPWHDTWYYDPLASRWFAYARLTGYFNADWSALERRVRHIGAMNRIGVSLCRPFSFLLGKAYRAACSVTAGRHAKRAPGESGALGALLLSNAEKRASHRFDPQELSCVPYRQVGLPPTNPRDIGKDIDVTGHRDFYRILFASPFLRPIVSAKDAAESDILMLDEVGFAGQSRSRADMLECALKGEKPLYFVEGGPVAGILDNCSCQTIPVRFRRTYSFIADDMALPSDPLVKSRLRRFLESGDLSIDGAARERCRRAIDCLVRNRLTRYGFAPSESRGDMPDGRGILIADQAPDDSAVSRGGADAATFERMLVEARKDHPNAIIHILPPLTALGTKGCLSDAQGEGIRHITHPANPYELFPFMAAVYVVNSPVGLEALLAGVPVVTYGRALYSGLGLTEDRNNDGIRRQLNLEELFHAVYLRQTLYFSPYSCENIGMEAFLGEMARLRDEYRRWTEGAEGLLCPPVRGLPEALECPVCQGAMILSQAKGAVPGRRG